MSVSRWPRNHVAILVGDHQIERVTGAPVRTACALIASIAVNASAMVACSLWSVASSALIGPPRVHQAILRHRAQIQAVWLEEYGLCATSVSRMTTSLDAAESTELLGVPCQLR